MLQPRPLGALLQAWVSSVLLAPLYWLCQKLVAAKVGRVATRPWQPVEGPADMRSATCSPAGPANHCRMFQHAACSSLLEWAPGCCAQRDHPSLFLLPAHPTPALQVRTALGVRKFVISGGGSLSPFLDAFYESIGLQVLNGWGLTETSPVLACRRGAHNVRGSVGECLRPCRLLLLPPAACARPCSGGAVCSVWHEWDKMMCILQVR